MSALFGWKIIVGIIELHFNAIQTTLFSRKYAKKM